MFIAYRLDLECGSSDNDPYDMGLDDLIREEVYNKEIAKLIQKGKNYVDHCEKTIKKAIGEYLTMDGTIDA